MASDGALWGALLEKSLAKYLGNYEAIDAGSGAHGIEAMTGSPYLSVKHENVIESEEGENLWNELVSKNEEGYMITTGSYTGTGNDQDSNQDGLPYNHAFSIMTVLTVVDDSGE